jgi:hypothetical protein
MLWMQVAKRAHQDVQVVWDAHANELPGLRISSLLHDSFCPRCYRHRISQPPAMHAKTVVKLQNYCMQTRSMHAVKLEALCCSESDKGLPQQACRGSAGSYLCSGS